MKLTSCHRTNLCTDCDSRTCLHAGNPQADCPKYECDNEKPYDCNRCSFIKKHLAALRADAASKSALD